MNSKNISLVLLMCGLTGLACAQDAQVPASPASALALPSTVKMPPAPSTRSEVEQLWDSGQKKQAQKKLEKWMSKEKASPWPWVVSARFQYEDKHYKRSVSLAQAAIQKSPGCGEAYYWRGKGYEALGKNLEAANEYQAAIIAEDRFSQAQADLDRVKNVLGPSPEIDKK